MANVITKDKESEHPCKQSNPPSKEGKKNFVRSLANFIPKAFRSRRGASGSNGSIRTHIDSMELNKRNASSRSFNQKTSSSTIGDSNSSSRHWKPRPEHPLLRWSTKEGK